MQLLPRSLKWSLKDKGKEGTRPASREQGPREGNVAGYAFCD
jgi:hypothetical protein